MRVTGFSALLQLILVIAVTIKIIHLSIFAPFTLYTLSNYNFISFTKALFFALNRLKSSIYFISNAYIYK